MSTKEFTNSYFNLNILIYLSVIINGSVFANKISDKGSTSLISEENIRLNNSHFFYEKINHLDDSIRAAINCDLSDIDTLQNSRIINIKSCGSFTLNHTKLSKLINDSPHVFILQFEINETSFNFESYHKKISTILKANLKRSIIINYYNKHDDKGTIKFIGESRRTIKLLNNFIDSSINDTEMMKDALRNDCTLCIRLMQMMIAHFRINDTCIDNNECGSDCFRALLNLPYNFDFSESWGNIYDELHHEHINSMKLSRSDAQYINENFTIEDFLDDKNFHTKCDTLTSLAWIQKEYEIFYFLIRADCSFPEKFIDERVNSLDYPSNNKFISNLERYIKEMKQFHKNIKDENFQKIQEYVESHQNLTFARNLNNQSALKAAFDTDNVKIFSYLKSAGMFFSDYTEIANYYDTKNKFSENKMKKMRQLNRKFIKKVRGNVIEKIIDQTFVFYDSKALNIEQITAEIYRIYYDLNEHISEILTIAASSSQLEIIIDFDNSDLDDFDPGMSNAYGAAYSFHDYLIISGFDFIGDDESKRNFALGTMAHELFHHATHQVYGNTFSPYFKDDKKRMKEFDIIYEKTKKLKNEDKLIKSAYDSNRHEEFNHGELIARIPDILLTNRHDLKYIADTKIKFNHLFNFYENKVLKDFRELIPSINAREKVREFNDWFDVIAEIEENDDIIIESSESDESENILKNIDDVANILFTYNTSGKLRKIYNEVMRRKVLAIFVKSSFAHYGNFKKVMLKIDAINPSVTLIIECDDMKTLNKFDEIFERTSFEKVVAIADFSNFKKFRKMGLSWTMI